MRLLLWIAMPQGQGKILYRGKTVFGFFGKGLHDDCFHGGWNVHTLRIDRRRRRVKMLGSNFDLCTPKGGISTEPFVNDDGERILITGRAGFAHNLFWSHINGGASRIFRISGQRCGEYYSDTKVAQQYLVVAPQQHVLGLNVSMDQVEVMRILQGWRNL